MEESIDTMNIIKKSKGNIHPNFDMEKEDFDIIIANSNSTYDLIYNGFRLGYMRGMKCSKIMQ